MSSSKKSQKAASTGKSARKTARVLKSRVVYRAPVFYVTSNTVKEPTGVTTRRDIIHHPGSVVVLAVDETGAEPQVLLERQFRYAAGKFLWELPAGSRDPGETTLEGAKRELLEETGYTARNWKRILHFYSSPGFLAETMSIYLARDLSRGTASPEEDEVIETRMFPLSELEKKVFQGKIEDAKTIAAVLWLVAWRNGA